MFQIYDLEVLKNYFLYIGLSLNSDEFYIFEISTLKNDLQPLIDHLKKLGGQIGFNSVGYDGQVQEYILRNSKKWQNLSGEAIASLIYQYSQKVIGRKENEWPDYREKDLSIRPLDLFRVWHYNNKARSCSLKWLQYSMDWHNVEDMPLKHYDLVNSRESADNIIEYCKNDCLSTRAHYRITIGKTENPLYKGIDKIQLRKDVQKEFGFYCMNFSDVKIGDEIMKTNYCKATGLDKYDLRSPNTSIDPFTFGECIPEYIKFESQELNDLLGNMKNIQVIYD